MIFYKFFESSIGKAMGVPRLCKRSVTPCIAALESSWYLPAVSVLLA